MKKLFLLGLVCLLAFAAVNVYDIAPSQKSKIAQDESTVVETKNNRLGKIRSAEAAGEWIHMNRGNVDASTYAKVRADIAQRRLLKQDDPLVWEEMGPNNVGGRTRGMVFDQDNPEKIVLGGVAGGIWISDNSGQNWRSVEDSFDKGCVAVVCMTQASNGDYYAGTGEGFYGLSGDGVRGIYGSGIFKSTDGGETWNVNAGTAPPVEPTNTGSGFATVDKIAAHSTNPAVVYAAAQGGMYMTSSAGANWSRIQDTDGNDITTPRGWDIAAASDGTVHFFTGTRYYRSVAGSTSQFELVTGNNVPGAGGRKVIAAQEADPNILYVATEGGICISTVKRSDDGGTTWETIAIGSEVFNPGSNGLQCQAGYDLAVAAHPTNPNIVYVAGVSLFRGTRVGDGWDWQQIDSLFEDPSNISYVHADKHDIVFKPGEADEMYVISDGGVARTKNASDEVPIFELRNRGYNVTQFYTVGADNDGLVLGGTQDNGSQFLNCSTNSSNTSVEVWGGDGGFSEISNINPNALFVGNPGGDLFRSGNGGEGFGGTLLDCNIDCEPAGNMGECGGDGTLDGVGAFVTPFFLWEDSELYHKVREVRLNPSDNVSDPITSSSAPGQTFFVTRTEALIAENEDELYTDLAATLDESQIFILYNEDTNQAVDYGPEDFRYNRSRLFIGDQAGGLWMTQDALNFQTTPFWVRIGDALGPIRSITASLDGNTVWAGTSNGTILRVNNLDNIDVNDIKLNDTDLCNVAGIAAFEDFAETMAGSATQVSGRPITGISTHPFDPNRVYYTVGGYNSTSHVFEISNASDSDIGDVEVDNISGNLPAIPAFDIVSSNPSGDLVVATDFGIWLGDISAPVNSMWTEANGGDIQGIPVFRVREEPMARVNPGTNSFCRVIYAGTHGRGAFRTTSLTNGGCTQDVIGRCQIVFSGIEEIAETEVSVFPNPATDFANVNFSINEDTELEVSVFSVTGQLVNRINRFEAVAGKNVVQINVGDVPNGNYIVVLRAGDYQASTKLNVAH